MRRKPRILIGIFAALIASPLSSQAADGADEPPTINLEPRWQLGDQYEIEYTKARQRFRDGEKTLDGGSRTRIQVQVIGEDASSFLLRWTWGESEVFGQRGAKSWQGDKTMLRGLLQADKGMVMVLRTDEFGSVARLENADEIRQGTRETMDALMDAAVTSGAIGHDEVAAVRRMMADLYGKEEFVGVLIMAPVIFYSLSGLSLPLGEPAPYEDMLPNPIGGPPIPARGVYEFTAYDPDSGLAVLEWKVIADPERAGQAIREGLEALARQQGILQDDPGTLGEVAIRDSSNVLYDVRAGLPRRFFWTRSVLAQGSRQVDVREFTLITRQE